MTPQTSRRALLGASLGAAAIASGCGTQSLDAYANEKPKLDLRQYFNGALDAYGQFADRSGQVVRRFKVLMTCTWKGDEGVLDEDFTYSDGKKERRIWRLKRAADGSYTGTADDVVGVANGKEVGNAFFWTYTLRLPVGDKVYDVQFEDWMYLIDEKVMLNKATMTKFGVRLGEVTLAFTKR
jgi:hypothetical protein